MRYVQSMTWWQTMFDAADRAKLADLARRAAENPMDFRDFTNPAKVREITRTMASLGIHIGTLTITLTHDRMPPDWRPYRHLSVSDKGQKPSDAVFLEIAREVGMGDTSKWDTVLVRHIERILPLRFNARHVFQPLFD
jgi:hypothetical protein